MTVRSRYMLAAVVGMWMAHPLPGMEPARLGLEASSCPAPCQQIASNQQVANAIVEQLRQSGQLRQYAIDVTFAAGTAELTGSVVDQGQREQALSIVKGVPGVERVQDHLTMTSAVTQVQATQKVPPSGVEVGPIPGLDGSKGPILPPGPIGPPEAVPALQAPSPSYYDLNPPKMPPYAWPTYAPYNNYSRVAYPLLYPYNAFPFVGPQYPFPKIPPGWRKVNLEWQDGYWWYGKNTNSHDWWRLRYW